MISVLSNREVLKNIEEKVGEITSVVLAQKKVIENDSSMTRKLYHIIVNEKLFVTVIEETGEKTLPKTVVGFSRHIGFGNERIFFAVTGKRKKEAGVPWRIAALTSAIKDDLEAVTLLDQLKAIAVCLRGKKLEKADLEWVLGKEIYEKLFFIKESEYDLLLDFLTMKLKM